MDDEVFPSNLLNQILKSLNEVNQKLDQSVNGQFADKWLDIQDVCLLLKISKRTLQSYRDERILSFSQIAGKIYFKKSDIDTLLETHYIKSCARR